MVKPGAICACPFGFCFNIYNKSTLLSLLSLKSLLTRTLYKPGLNRPIRSSLKVERACTTGCAAPTIWEVELDL